MWKEQVFFAWYDSSAGQLLSSNKQTKPLADHFYEKWIQVAGSSILATQWALAYNLGMYFYTCIKKEVVTYQKFFTVTLDEKIMKWLTFLFDDSILLIFLTSLYVFPLFVCFILNES